jgi:acyl-CoA synthetase (AMP-forming)/AMP-acid ligase II
VSLNAARSIAHGEQLARLSRKYPLRPALVCGERVWTYQELDSRVERLAAGLAGVGVGPGARLAVLTYNSLEMVETIFAGWRLGAIVVPINFRLVAGEVRFVVEDSNPSAVVVDQSLAHLVPAGPPVVVIPGEEGILLDGVLDFHEVRQRAVGAFVAPVVEDTDAALICYTSGTTGRPKGAVLSHFNLFMSTMNSMVLNGSGHFDEVWYSNLPLFHIGGLTGLLPQIVSGGSSVIVPSLGFDPARAVADLEAYGITACAFVGMQWDEICDQIAEQRVSLRLRRVSWGAANTPPEVLEKIARTLPGVPVFSFFGQTEMSPVTCVLTGEDADRKRGSVGRPILNVEARLVDDHGKDVRPGQVGEIVYRGPTVMQGYWNLPEATEQAFAGGWFHSGDLCREDEEGYLYVVDRKSDMIISGPLWWPGARIRDRARTKSSSGARSAWRRTRNRHRWS